MRLRRASKSSDAKSKRQRSARSRERRLSSTATRICEVGDGLLISFMVRYGGATVDSPFGAPIPPFVPSGALCGNHPQTPAIGTCSRCGTFFCYACGSVDPVGAAMCAACAPKSGLAIPWERRHEIGFFPGLIETIKLVMFRPLEAFSAPSQDLGYGSPILFTIIVQVVAMFFASIYQLGASALTERGEAIALEAALFGGFLVVSPLIFILFAFIGTGLLHLCLLIVGGVNKDFFATFRVVTYSSAASLLNVVPICGGCMLWFGRW